jgi:hypothetical protein
MGLKADVGRAPCHVAKVPRLEIPLKPPRFADWYFFALLCCCLTVVAIARCRLPAPFSPRAAITRSVNVRAFFYAAPMASVPDSYGLLINRLDSVQITTRFRRFGGNNEYSYFRVSRVFSCPADHCRVRHRLRPRKPCANIRLSRRSIDEYGRKDNLSVLLWFEGRRCLQSVRRLQLRG